ncbi:hypothetical protein E3N88_45073 [Mikania micrantha]|uniref:Uncharacterized protein n=1 Tax=Mikania micrantha TaxID=192012 RepID=A0A5N6LA95_9ASTR|nr:hypothetical protein E3N88_45073 [Mikania micrantha]
MAGSQSLQLTPTGSAYWHERGRSLHGHGLSLQHKDEVIPHLEPGRLPSTIDPDAVQPPDKGKKVPQRPVRISAWKLAKLDSNEAIKAGAKARASSSVLRPLSSKYNPDDPDRLSSSNLSIISSSNSAAHHKRSHSKNSYPPSRASREDTETCNHSVSNMSSPGPGREHFNPVYQPSANQSPWSGKNEPVTVQQVAAPGPRRNNWVPVKVQDRPPCQSIFFGGPLVGGGQRGPTTVSYYQQGRSQRGGQLPVFVPSEQNQNPRL